MKKYKKILSFMLVVLCIFSFTYTTSSKNNDKLYVKFKDFEFVTNDYNLKNVRVEYEKIGMKEKAYIIDNDTNDVLETMTVFGLGYRMDDVHPYTFVRSVSYGQTTVDFHVNVELYSKGSFRSINSYQGSYLTIATSVTNTYLEGSNTNVWSPKGFPTTELYYAFNGTIIAEVKSGFNASISAKLLDAGFSVGANTKELLFIEEYLIQLV